jgi:hypothetical protein
MTADKERQVAVRVVMPESTRNLLKAKAAKNGSSMTEVILEFVDGYIEDEKPSKSRDKTE